MSAVDETATVIINSDNISFTDTNGTPIDEIDGAYEVIPISENYSTPRKEYVVPAGDYIIQNYSDDIDEFRVSIANELDYMDAKTEDLSASVKVGVNSSTGRTHAYINSSDDSKNIVQALTNTGTRSYIESTGAVLGTESISSENIKITSDSTVNFDGAALTVRTDGEVGSVDLELNADSDDNTSDEDYAIALGDSTLIYDNNAVTGSLSFKIYNNIESVNGAKFITALYSSDGKFISLIENKDVVLGVGSNYINLGDINIPDLNNDGYYIKSFLWESTGSMTPLANAHTLNI